MNRTDEHSPLNLITENYAFAFAYDGHPEEGDRGASVAIVNALVEDGYRFDSTTPHNGDTCDHCGARLRYVAVLTHEPSRTLIRVGETCLDNRFALATPAFHTLRKAAALNRERRTLQTAKAAFRAVEANDEALRWLESRLDAGDHGFNGFYFDLVHKFNRYGSLSERQIAAVAKAAQRQADYDARKVIESVDASPVLIGKQIVTGTILSTKYVDSQYGTTYKMLVRDDRGFKVFGTVPSAIDEAVKGDRVSFTATLEASTDDPTFGFYKRPTKPTLTKEV
jgi:hypothetical protein